MILSGGVGSRLWPISRELYPKPFIKMANGLSVLQNTFLRVAAIPLVKSLTNVTNREFLYMVKNEYQEISDTINNNTHTLNYILEPFGRNTAAAIGLAALQMLALYGEDAVLLVLPSDHLITNQEAFNQAVLKAYALARQGKIVAFGIKPNCPATGYGYLHVDGNEVKKFVEKPSLEQAEIYLKSGDFLWNSGMFCFQAKVMLQEMALHCNDILSAVTECFEASKGNGIAQLNIEPTTFANVREDSIDYAIMEKSALVAVIPCDIGWSDIGTWSAMAELLEPDLAGNVVKGDAVLDKVTNCYIESNSRMIGAVNISDLIIIDTPDALLVANKQNSQDVKNIYAQLKRDGHETHKSHKIVHRPWGAYTVLEEYPAFKLKRIEVNPGASLSLQMHQHRSEHWVVVEGIAKIVNGENELLLEANQSTYISKGNKHRLSNPSRTNKLVIVEIQLGEYLGEDDIVRFDDVYGRVET